MAPKTVDWSRVLVSARPTMLIAIDLLLQTKKLKRYQQALRLIGIAVDRLIPVAATYDGAAAVRKTHAELAALSDTDTTERRVLLEKLRTQLSAL